MIALACDHTGVALKAEIAKMLDEMGLEWKDFEQVAFLGSQPAGSDINGFIKFSCGLEQPWLPMRGSVLMAGPLVQAGWCEK